MLTVVFLSRFWQSYYPNRQKKTKLFWIFIIDNDLFVFLVQENMHVNTNNTIIVSQFCFSFVVTNWIQRINEPCSAISISRRPYCACFIRRTAKSLKPREFFCRQEEEKSRCIHFIIEIKTDMLHFSYIRSRSIFCIAVAVACGR